MNIGNQHQEFWVADYRVQPALSKIVKDGQVIQLEPKVMALLELFASQPGKVFSRQDLEDSIWKGTIVGYDALSKAVTKLRDALGDDKKNPQYIQTISKKGYRFIARVSTDSPLNANDLKNPEDSKNIPHGPGKSRTANRNKLITGALLIVVVTTLATLALFRPSAKIDAIPQSTQRLYSQITPEIRRQGKPAIVVLPFRNISPSEGDAYLADGITSDLITDLSRLSGLWVMAINAALVYKDIDVSPEVAKQEFNARYVLSGEVNKVGQAIRINVHLTDAEQGNILWADRYDRQFTDIFDIQDEVTQKIVQSLSLTLSNEEKQRIARRYTHNLQAYEYFLRGLHRVNVRTAEDNEMAREMYQKAIDLDPSFARAYAGLAMTYAIGYVRRWPSSAGGDPLDKALQLSSQAIKLDRDLPESYWVAGYVYGQLKNTDKAIELLNHALLLNPNYADAYGMLGWISISIGKPELALDYIAKALMLNPIGGYLYQIQLGRAHYFMGDYELAQTYFNRAYQGNPVYVDTMLYLAATYVNLKRYDDAVWMLTEIKLINPDLDPQVWANHLPIRDENFKQKLQKDIIQAKMFYAGTDK